VLNSQSLTDRAVILDDFELLEVPEMASSIFLINSVEKSLLCSA